MNDSDTSRNLNLEETSTLRQRLQELERSNHQCQQQIESLTQQLTQEKAARQAAEERLQLTLTSAEMVAWDMDLTTNQVVCSPNALKIWGIQEGTGEDFFAVIHPDDRQRVIQSAERAIAGETEYVQEYRVIGPDGVTRWLNSQGRVYLDAAGRGNRVIGLSVDVTDRKQTELALRQREEQLRVANERFQLAANAVNSMVYDWHVEADWVERSDGFTSILGYSLEEAETTGQWWRDRIHPDDLQLVVADAALTLAKEDHCSVEYRVRNKADQYLYVLDQCLVVTRDAHGNPTRIVGSTTDISERKRTERQLQESQRFIQQIADAMPGTLYVYDLLEQRNVYVNRQIGELLGYSPEQIQAFGDQLFPQLIHPADFAAIGLQFERLHQAQDGEIIDYEYRMRHISGKWIWLWSRNTVSTRTPDGLVHQVVGTVHDITDRKQAEAELRQREQEFRAVVENTPDIIVRYDRDLRHLYVNPSIERALGIPSAQFIGKTGAELGFTDPTSQAWDEILQQVFATGQSRLLEFNFPNPEGELRSYQARFVPEMIQQDQVTTVLAVATDVTEYRRTETSLRQSEERLRLTMEGAQMGTWDLDLNTGKAFWSEQHFTMLGYEPLPTGEGSEEMWGRRLHPEDVARVNQLWQQSRLDHTRYKAEYRVIRADNGQIAWLAALGSFAYDHTGEATRSIGVVFDITERKKAEADLQESRDRFRDLADNIPQLAWMADGQGWLFWYNQRWFDYTGTTFEEMQGWGWQKVHHPDHVERVTQKFRSHLEAGKIWEDTFPIRRQDGQYRWFLSRAVPIRDEQGNVLRWFGTNTDITDRQQAEVEREQLLRREQVAREQAEAANRVKDEFLAVLSHELRTPLNPILGWARLLRTRQFDSPATDRALDTIERNAKLQAQLIEDLLDVSRILQGKLSLNVGSVNLAQTIEASLETVRLSAEAKGIQIQASLSTAVGLVVNGDANRLQQVVWNLLSNAVKFTPTGGRVEVRLEQVETIAQIQVSDTGQGISPDFLPYVFEYFRQADSSTTRHFGGLGLGLAIVRHLVELHGGIIKAESPGSDMGATFTVQLPLMTTALVPALEALPAQGTKSLDGLCILIVDDEADMRDLTRFILEEQGAIVRVAASADEAVQHITQSVPDVLISDIGMPTMDGYDLMRQISATLSAQGKRIPAIALTAYAGDTNQHKALAAGFRLHLAKPIEPEHLVKAVAQLMTQSFKR